MSLSAEVAAKKVIGSTLKVNNPHSPRPDQYL